MNRKKFNENKPKQRKLRSVNFKKSVTDNILKINNEILRKELKKIIEQILFHYYLNFLFSNFPLNFENLLFYKYTFLMVKFF